jgi:hypothetical protein
MITDSRYVVSGRAFETKTGIRIVDDSSAK